MLNTEKAKFINIVAKLLKQFTKSEEFFEKTGLNSSSSYFNINLYKSLLKYLLLKTSCLPFHYFKNNFKKIKVCKLNGSFLKKKKKKKINARPKLSYLGIFGLELEKATALWYFTSAP